MNTDDFIDYHVVANSPTVKTASKDASLQIAGKGAILLSHFVEKISRLILGFILSFISQD
jgi:hypothetical protein